MCTLLLMAGWTAYIVDVKGAFLHGDFEDGEKIYMEVPKGFRKYYATNIVLLLLQTLYGLKQASSLFLRIGSQEMLWLFNKLFHAIFSRVCRFPTAGMTFMMAPTLASLGVTHTSDEDASLSAVAESHANFFLAPTARTYPGSTPAGRFNNARLPAIAVFEVIR